MFSSFLRLHKLQWKLELRTNSKLTCLCQFVATKLIFFFPFLSTDPDQQDACQKVVPFHKMMSSAVEKLFHIPSSARIVSFCKN